MIEVIERLIGKGYDLRNSTTRMCSLENWWGQSGVRSEADSAHCGSDGDDIDAVRTMAEPL